MREFVFVAKKRIICSSNSAQRTISPMRPMLLKYINIIIRTGIIVSMVNFPRNVRTKSITVFIFTPSARITPMPNTFLPTVCPFLRQIGTINSVAAKARRMESEMIVSVRLKTLTYSFIASLSAVSASYAFLYCSCCSSVIADASSFVILNFMPYSASYAA